MVDAVADLHDERPLQEDFDIDEEGGQSNGYGPPAPSGPAGCACEMTRNSRQERVRSFLWHVVGAGFCIVSVR